MKSIKMFNFLTVGVLAVSIGLAGCSTTQSTSVSSSTKATTTKAGQPLVIVPSPQGSFQENFNPFALSTNYGLYP